MKGWSALLACYRSVLGAFSMRDLLVQTMQPHADIPRLDSQRLRLLTLPGFAVVSTSYLVELFYSDI